MENCEEVLQILDRFSKIKPTDIPKELDDYLGYVARTGDTVFRWSNIKQLFKEKLKAVMKEFHETSASVEELPQYPNVDPFNYEAMKSTLLERLELFNAAPFTVQRLCELLTDPRRQYTRIDKYMRALEKNILVVSTTEPGRKAPENENSEPSDSVVNGDLSSEVNVKVGVNGEESTFKVETTRPIEMPGTGEATTTDGSESSETLKTDVETNEKYASLHSHENPAKDDDNSMLAASESRNLEKNPIANNIESINDESKPFEKTSPSFSEKYSTDDDKFNSLDASETKTEVDSSTSANSSILPDFQNESTSSLKSATNADELTETDKQEDLKEGDTQDNSNTANTSTENLGPETQPDAILTLNESKPVSQSEGDAVTNEECNPEFPTQKEESEDSKLKSESHGEDACKATSNEIQAEKKLNKSQELMAIEEVSTTSSSGEVYSATPDQPMDDNLDTAQDAVVNTCGNESIMHSETDMVTDIYMNKTDPNVMEIDDTSQEAMDQ